MRFNKKLGSNSRLRLLLIKASNEIGIYDRLKELVQQEEQQVNNDTGKKIYTLSAYDQLSPREKEIFIKLDISLNKGSN